VFAALPLPAESVVAITDAERRVLVRSLEPERYVGRVLHGDESEEGEWSVHVGSDNVRRMYVRQTIVRGPWVLSVGIPMSIAWGESIAVWKSSVSILAVGLAGWLIIAVALSKRLS
jgi:hypothetical protein